MTFRSSQSNRKIASYPSDMYPFCSEDWLPVAIWEAYEDWLDD